MRLRVKVVPSSSRDTLSGWLGDVLKVRVSAPPERGRANAAVEELVARALGIPRDRVRIVGGHASPRKVLALEDISEDWVYERLAKPGFPAKQVPE